MSPDSTPAAHPDTFGARTQLAVGGRTYEIFNIKTPALADRHDIERLPYSVKVILENLLRHEDGPHVSADDIVAVAAWGENPEGHGQGAGDAAHEIALTPERVLMQDFTGVPGVVDLAAMRDALARLGGEAARVNPLVPVELVIDHSVIVERSGNPAAYDTNVSIEYQRNMERYQLLRWAQGAFGGFRAVPPGMGICHQVNLEFLSRLVFATDDGRAFCDTLVGTDSHTTMVNGLGVLGWGVGGIEAEAAMLGQPLSMLLPPVVGLRISGEPKPGITATDVVLTVTELLRDHGVVGAFVECYGPGVAALPLETRATIGNMSPEYGATCTMFPIDQVTLDYLRFTGREDGASRPGGGVRQGPGALARPRSARTRVLRVRQPRPRRRRALAGGAVPAPGPGLAGGGRRRLPRRPRPVAAHGGHPPARRRTTRWPTGTWSSPRSRAAPTRRTHRSWSRQACSPGRPSSAGCAPSHGSRRPWRPGPGSSATTWSAPASPGPSRSSASTSSATAARRASATEPAASPHHQMADGDVVIAAITSCTNTSNPQVMVAAGLLAQRAVDAGFAPSHGSRPPWRQGPGSSATISSAPA